MRTNIIVRKKIEKRMNEALNNSINVLVAPTGYGKTQALKAFGSFRDVKIVEISEQHKRVEKFCEKFCVDLFGKNIASQIRKIDTINGKIDFLIAMLNIAASRNRGLTIVIDNYQRIESPDNNELLLKIAIEVSKHFNISIFIASRRMPKGKLGTFISQRPSSALTMEQFVFDKDELSLFLQENNIIMNESESLKVLDSVKGWTEGLVTKLMAVNSGQDEMAELYGLIRSNLLPLFSREMRAFLLVVSKIERFTSKITEFFEGKNSIRKELSKNAECHNFIIKSDTYYMLHPVLKGFFDSNFTVDTNATRRLADYYFSEEEYIQAFLLYYEIKEYQIMSEICKLLADHKFFDNKKEIYFQMLSKLPAQYIHQCGELSIWYAYISGKYLTAEKRVGMFDHGLQLLLKNTDISKNENQLRGQIGILKAFVYRNNWQKMLEELRKVKKIEGDFHIAALQGLKFNLSSPSSLYINYSAGELDEIVEASKEIEEITSHIGNRLGLGSYMLTMGEALYLRGERREAFKYVDRALSISKEAKQYSLVLAALYLEIKLFAHDGNFRSAESCISSINYMSTKLPDKSKVIVGAAKAWLYPRIGKTVPKYFTETANFNVEALIEKEQSFEMLIYMINLYYMERYSDAYAYAVQVIQYYKVNNCDMGLIYVNIYAAFCCHRTGEKDLALRHIMVAYNLTKDDRIIMPFIEAGTDMIDIINEYKENFPTAWRLNVLREVKVFNLSVEKSRYSNKYRLSKREVDVMELVSLGMKNSEIAKELKIKQDTVKEYLHNVFVKLGVTNRIEAAMKFNET